MDDLLDQLSPDAVHGWTLDDATEHKKREAARMKQQWESLLTYHRAINLTLSEIDDILKENDKQLETHLGGDNFPEISHGNITDPEEIALRPNHDIAELHQIENYFFQNLTDENRHVIKDTPIRIDVMHPFSETVELRVQFTNLSIYMPTLQSYYNQIIGERLEYMIDK